MVKTSSDPPDKFALLAVVGARLGPESIAVHPTPLQLQVSEFGSQLLARASVKVALLTAAPVAVVVSVKVDEPPGLLMLSNEFEGKAAYEAAARLAVVELPL